MFSCILSTDQLVSEAGSVFALCAVADHLFTLRLQNDPLTVYFAEWNAVLGEALCV